MKKKLFLPFATTLLLLLMCLYSVAAAKANLFAVPEVNRIIDENYAEVQKNGYAKLILPRSLHDIGEEKFSKNSIAAVKTLIAAGHEAYVIGGATRDIIMGKQPNDFDIVTDASLKEIAALLPNVTFHAISDGTRFGVAHYDGENVDVASFVNIPSMYYGQKGIPDFDPTRRYGKDASI